MSRKVIAIGCSAGGVSALRDLLYELPSAFAAPIVVAMHSQPESRLRDVLEIGNSGGPELVELTDGMKLKDGVVHVVPGATHAFFTGDAIRLSETVRDSGFRPSIDALFMSLASEHREDAVAVVLSGTLNDGMRGAQVIYDMGGVTVVQDPEDAAYADMPQNVINADHPRRVLSASELGVWLRDLVQE